MSCRDGDKTKSMLLSPEHYQWRPIDEINEDYGTCVLINLFNDDGYTLGHVCDSNFNESDWTHFTRFTPLTIDEYDRLMSTLKS